MIQISGGGRDAKADVLASRMREVIGSVNFGVKVGRPAKVGAIRVAGSMLVPGKSWKQPWLMLGVAVSATYESVRPGRRRQGHAHAGHSAQ